MALTANILFWWGNQWNPTRPFLYQKLVQALIFCRKNF
jgi:hypothetical protein